MIIAQRCENHLKLRFAFCKFRKISKNLQNQRLRNLCSKKRSETSHFTVLCCVRVKIHFTRTKKTPQLGNLEISISKLDYFEIVHKPLRPSTGMLSTMAWAVLEVWLISCSRPPRPTFTGTLSRSLKLSCSGVGGSWITQYILTIWLMNRLRNYYEICC